MHFECKPFNQLSLTELYDILKLRQEIFIVEQNCPYVDADGLDLFAWHLMGRDDQGKLQTYTRLLDKGISYPEYPSIGRVITSAEVRGSGAGKLLMEESIRQVEQLFGKGKIKISAQCYITRFYEGLGFKPVGETYLEDDIPHIAMIR